MTAAAPSDPSLDRPRVRLRGPGVLVASLPQLVGYPPVESVVLVGLVEGPTGRHEVALTLRADLAHVREAITAAGDDPAASEAISEAARLWLEDDPKASSDDTLEADEEADVTRPAAPGHLAGLDRRPDLIGALPHTHPLVSATALRRNGCVAAIAILVSDQARFPGEGRHTDPTDGTTDEDPVHLVASWTQLCLSLAGIEVTDLLVVREGRWWSLYCDDPTCCPDGGRPIDPADSDRLASAKVLAGLDASVRRDRSAVAGLVAPVPLDDPVGEAVRRALEPGHERTAPGGASDEDPHGVGASIHEFLTLVDEVLRAFEDRDPHVDPDTWARLIRGVAVIRNRDAALAHTVGSRREIAVRMWCTATRLAPPGWAAAPATVAGALAYAHGDGALAGDALARALTDQPEYSFARLLMHGLLYGMPSSSVASALENAPTDLGGPTRSSFARRTPRKRRARPSRTRR